MMTWSSLMFSNPCSPLMECVVLMNDYVSLFLMSVLIFVSMNIGYTGFMKSFNLEFFESHGLESAWTLSPFLILLTILIPSLSSLYLLDSCFYCGIAVSVIGHQWYWSYFYKDLSASFFDAYMLSNQQTTLRLLDVDNRVVIPSETPVRFLVTSSDVIHSWTLPSLGFKMDAIPGRVNQFCFSSTRTGLFFGQCSEICGANHSFMPIVMESVSFSDYFHLIS